MSDLEQLTKPILGPMVTGVSIELPGVAQAILAAWMLKTLMVFDWAMGRKYWRQEERALLSRQQPGLALSNSMTYIGRYSGTYRAMAYPRNQTVRRLSGEDTEIPVFSGVLVVGEALMWLQTDRYKEQTGRDGLLWPPKHYDRMTLLGGPSAAPFRWPAKLHFDDLAFNEFLDRDGVS